MKLANGWSFSNTSRPNWLSAKVENLEINTEETGKVNRDLLLNKTPRQGGFTAELLSESMHVMCLQLIKYSLIPFIVIVKNITPVLFKLFQALGKHEKAFNLLYDFCIALIPQIS